MAGVPCPATHHISCRLQTHTHTLRLSGARTPRTHPHARTPLRARTPTHTHLDLGLASGALFLAFGPPEKINKFGAKVVMPLLTYTHKGEPFGFWL